YVKDGAVYATNVDTGATRKILEDARIRGGSGFGLSADETLLAGSFVKEDAAAPRNAQTANPLATPPPQESTLGPRWAQHLPKASDTISRATGEPTIVYESTDWLNHLHMPPADPTLIMYRHEGPWHKVDRIWTIRTDGSNRKLIHERPMEMEIAGHEFFSAH